MPAPDIAWYKDGTLLAPSSEVIYSKGGRQLQLGKAQHSDAGLYTCQASNPAGIAKKSTSLEVYGEQPGVVAMGSWYGQCEVTSDCL